MKYDLKILGLLALIWIVIIIIINPNADVCINDDWAYARPVANFLVTGQIHLTDWSSMTLVFHVLWGALFSSVFGFSFTVLRISVLALGFSGYAGSYLLFKELTPSKKLAFIGASLIALNPIYLQNSFSFMTDVSFYGFMIWAVYFFVKFFKNERFIFIALAITFGVISLWIREVSLILAFGFACGYVFKNGLNRKTVFTVFIVFAAFLGAYIAYRWWYVNIHGVTEKMDYCRDSFVNTIFSINTVFMAQFIRYSHSVISLFVLTFLPLMVLSIYQIGKTLDRRRIRISILATSIFVILLSILLILKPENIESIGSYLIGSFLHSGIRLPNVFTVVSNENFELPSAFLWFIILLSASVATFWVCGNIFKAPKHIRFWKSFKKQDGISFFLAMSLIAYIIPISTQHLFPRYMLVAFPFMCGLLLISLKVTTINIKAQRFSIFVFIVLSVISLLIERDYMEYNRQKAVAASYLMNVLNVSPKEIDGMLEFNAWYFFDSKYIPTPEKNWYWVQNDKYVIYDKIIKDYEVIKEFSFTRLLPPTAEEKLYVMKKND
jgi:hypothetical protein